MPTEPASYRFIRPLLFQTLAALTLFALSNDDSLATPLFPAPVVEAGLAPRKVVVSDLNLDGVSDLVVMVDRYPVCDLLTGCYDVPGRFSIFLGRGGGTFAAHGAFGTGPSEHTAGLAVGDLNLDSIPDFVLSDGLSILVLLGDGTGSGTFADLFPVNDAFSITLGDLNADRKPDIVVATPGGNFFFAGEGSGHFGSASPLEGVPAIGDLNEDGKQDVALGHGDSVSILLSQPDGTLAPGILLPVGAPVSSLYIADVSGDGAQDLLVTSGHDALVFLGSGGGALGPPILSTGAAGDSVLRVSDLSRDGRQDLLVRAGGELAVFTGGADGAFSQHVRMGGGGFTTLSADVGDFNADGEPDLAVVDAAPSISGGAVTRILFGTGGGSFVAESSLQVDQAPAGVASGDFNADGLADLAVANASSNDLSVLLGLRSGGFLPQVRYSVGSLPGSIAAGDFNADARLDLVVGNRQSSDLSVLLGDGDGHFQTEVRSPALPDVGGLVVADFNRDGKQDVAYLAMPSPDVFVSLGNGDGTVGPPARFSVGAGARALFAGDFNSDHLVDLAVGAHGDGDLVVLLLGSGEAVFTPGPVVRLDGPVSSLTLGDLNGDGRPDLAVTVGQHQKSCDDTFCPIVAGSVSVLFGTGDGGFAFGLMPFAGDDPRSAVIGDFNGDGRRDLAVGLGSGNFLQTIHATHNLAVFLGTGNGDFLSPLRFASCAAAGEAADFNADGKDDLYHLHDDRICFALSHATTTNLPPQARAGFGRGIPCISSAGAPVALDGSGSSDADSTPGTHDDIVSFQWYLNYGLPAQSLLGTGEIITVTLPLGNSAITLRVVDSQGEASTNEVVVTVFDLVPPAIVCPAAVRSECAPPGGALAELRATATDACSAGVSIVNDRSPAGADASGVFPVGTTTVAFTATDAAGNHSSCTATVTVVADTTPPALSLAASPLTLWPPDHRMIAVQTQAAAGDACDPTPSITLMSAGSSEPDDATGAGDGGTSGDIQDAGLGTADFGLSLRAERDGAAEGRTYTLTYAATDAAGNRTLASVAVQAPHDRSGLADPVGISARETSSGTLLEWSEVPEAYSYRAIRGEVDQLRQTSTAIDLGKVVCLGSEFSSPSTTGAEDASTPPPGETYFYLVAYEDGLGSSYGAADASKPRSVASGDCR